MALNLQTESLGLNYITKKSKFIISNIADKLIIENCNFKAMKNIYFICFLTIIQFYPGYAQQALQSSVYEWEKLPFKKTPTGEVRDILQGPTRSLDMFDIKAVTLSPLKEKWNFKVKSATDELIIIKEGVVAIQVNAEQKILGEGSVIVAGSDDEVVISNKNTTNAIFYLISFKPFRTKKETWTPSKVAPLFIDWNNIEFKPSENGGRRNLMKQKTSSLKELEIHVTTLKEGVSSHAPHSHPDEEIILVRQGIVEMNIKGEPYPLGPGSIILLTSNDPHGLRNAGAGQCEYYAVRWLTNVAGSK